MLKLSWMQKWKTWLYLALATPPAIVLCLHAYNGSYTRFISDDYCAAYFSERLGMLRNIWFWYTTLQGHYAGFASDYVLVLTGTKWVGVIPALALLVWGTALIAALFGIQPKSQDVKSRLWNSVCFGIVVLFVVLLFTPSITQSLYWWKGFATHTLPLMGFTIYLAIYQWLRTRQPNKRITIIAVTTGFGLAFIDGGFSETFTAIQIVFLVLWMAWLFARKELDFRQPGACSLAAGLAGALVALVIVVASPGNAVRQSYFPPTPGILTILQISFSGYSALLKNIFATPEKIFGLVGVFIGFIWFGKQIPPERTVKRWEPFVILLNGFSILPFICFAPAAFGLSDIAPERAQIIPVFFLILSTVIAGFLLGNQRPGSALPSSGIAHENLGLLAIAVVLIMLSAGINGKGVFDSSKIYIKYAQAWDQNEQKIFDAVKSGQQTVIIHSVRNWTGLNDPGDNPKFFINYCMSKYYKINILADNTGMQPPEP
jgi:hypothetical protein